MISNFLIEMAQAEIDTFVLLGDKVVQHGRLCMLGLAVMMITWHDVCDGRTN